MRNQSAFCSFGIDSGISSILLQILQVIPKKYTLTIKNMENKCITKRIWANLLHAAFLGGSTNIHLDVCVMWFIHIQMLSISVFDSYPYRYLLGLSLLLYTIRIAVSIDYLPVHHSEQQTASTEYLDWKKNTFKYTFVSFVSLVSLKSSFLHAPIHDLVTLQRPVFLVNSYLGLVTATS